MGEDNAAQEESTDQTSSRHTIHPCQADPVVHTSGTGDPIEFNPGDIIQAYTDWGTHG